MGQKESRGQGTPNACLALPVELGSVTMFLQSQDESLAVPSVVIEPFLQNADKGHRKLLS